MDSIKDGWFRDAWAGEAMSLQVEEILFHQTSPYQDVLVFKSANFGNVLVLDGYIQIAERDEFAYQEMCAFLPLNSHPNPERVMIVGGGDGGVAREVVKHPKVKEVVLCEIDQMVIDVSKKYLPSMAVGFDSAKLKVNVGDGFEYLKNHNDYFDVIITDSSDAKIVDDESDPAACLFQEDYFRLLNRALRDGGIACSQGLTMWFQLDLAAKLKEMCQKIFPVVDLAITSVPTFTGGQELFLLNSKNNNTNFRDPVTTWTDCECEERKLSYYSSDIHRAAFVLPRFAVQALEKAAL